MTVTLPFGELKDPENVSKKCCALPALILRQAQDERVFPLVVSLSNHEHLAF